MPLRVSIGLGVLVGVLFLGMSCSGPSAGDGAPSGETSSESARAYHVQLDMTREKETADRILGRALRWWEARAEGEGLDPVTGSEESLVTVAWRAPLYRIRIGPFASRAQADSVLRTARSTFPGAFVRPANPSAQP